MRKRYLIVALMLLSGASLFVGVHDISPLDVFDLTEEQHQILWVSRLPRLASIIMAGMGEDFAVNLGPSYKFVVNLGLVIVALVTSVVVLTVGIKPFLGLIIPNIVSIFRRDHLHKICP